jgi:hypothetical protein
MLRLWLRTFLLGTAGGLLSLLFAFLAPRWVLLTFLIWPARLIIPPDVPPSSMTDEAVVIGISILINGIVYVAAATVIFLMRGGVVISK